MIWRFVCFITGSHYWHPPIDKLPLLEKLNAKCKRCGLEYMDVFHR